MIIQTLTFGSKDLSSYCRKNSLEVTPERIQGRSWTDIQGKQHVTTIRWTYRVTADLNPMSYEDAANLFDLMKGGPQTLVASFAGDDNTGTITQTSIMEVFGFKPTFSSRYVQATGQLQFTEAY